MINGASACPYCDAHRPEPREGERCSACNKLRILDGRYEVLSLLGKGGTGAVYLGRDRETQSEVAIKVVGLQDWKVMDLFERGHAALVGLHHIAVPRAYAFIKDGGTAYQIREYCAGGSAQDLVQVGRHLDRKQIHFLLRELLEVLDYLHTRHPSIIHRDVKPANIMFRSADELHPVLVDFDASTSQSQHGTGTTIIVSPGYSALEQLAGYPCAASDLYGLGMTMLYLLSGRAPNDLPRKNNVIQTEELFANLEPATRHVMKSLIQSDLKLRYASARSALDELAGRFDLSAHNSVAQKSALTKPIVVVGTSIFRITVGVLLGVLLGYFYLVVEASKLGR